jgi:hypothetical protein
MAKTRSLNLYELVGIEIGPGNLDGLATVSTKALRRVDAHGRSGDVMKTANARAIRAALDQQQRIVDQSRPRLSQFGMVMALPRTALDRINIAMRSRGEGNRRRVSRFPFSAQCRLMTPSGILEGRTLDISAHGFRMGTAQPHLLAIGQECMVEIEGIGHVSCIIRQHGRHGINIAFTSPLQGGQRSALAGMLLRLAGEQEYMASRAREMALVVTEKLEHCLNGGEISAADLFVNHEPALPDPMLFDGGGSYGGFAEMPVAPHPLTEHLGGAVGPLLGRLMGRFNDIEHLALTDRNGGTALVLSRAGLPVPECLRHPEPDAMTLRIARFTDEATIQFRPPGEGGASGLLELSATVKVHGRRWGCARILMATPTF